MMTNRVQTDREGLANLHGSSRRSFVSYKSQINRRSQKQKQFGESQDDSNFRDSFNVTQQLNIIPDHAGLLYATVNNVDRAENIGNMSQN